MKRKLGPLQLWQWLAIGVALGLGTYLYRRGHPALPAVGAATPNDQAFNPIDPTTGLPFAGGLPGGIDTTGATTAAGPPQTLGDLLAGMAQVQDLMSGLQSLRPDQEPGPATDTSKDTPATQTGAKPPPKKPKKPKSTAQLLAELRDPHSKAHQARVRAMLTARGVKIPKTHHGGHKNPGHSVKHHSGGRRSPSSSAPHNPRQHHHVAPPAHQRHHPTKHHRRHR